MAEIRDLQHRHSSCAELQWAATACVVNGLDPIFHRTAQKDKQFTQTANEAIIKHPASLFPL